MTIRRPLAAATMLLTVLGVSAILAQKEDERRAAPPSREPDRTLDPDVFALRLLLGVGDAEPRAWDGRVSVDRGEVVGVEGWRFREGDDEAGQDAWKARSLAIRAAAKTKAATQKQAVANAKPSGPGNTGPAMTPNGVIVTVKAPKGATLSVETDRGRFVIPLAELEDGSPRRYLDGRVEARRVAPGVPLVEGPAEDDFPAAAIAPDGSAWVAYVSHEPRGPEVSEALQERPKSFVSFIPRGGGDQVRLLRFADGKAGAPIDVTGPNLDVWRPSVAVDAGGKVVVAWSENRDGNWDIVSRTFDPSRSEWSEARRLTSDPGPDLDVALASDPKLGVWMAWQGWRDGQADILLAPVDRPGDPTRVGVNPSNEWSPSLAIRDGEFHVAYDTYQAGNYDVMLWSRPSSDGPGATVAVADSPRFEARPSIAVGPGGRVWVAFEERTEGWGKDAENLVSGEGSSLYRESKVRMRCVEGGRVSDAPDPVANAPEPLREMNSYPRLACDESGRVWLLFRNRLEAIWGNNAVMVVGGVWLEYATSLAGDSWEPPMLLPRSDGLLDNRPALVVRRDGPPLAFYNSDGRLRREVEFTPDLRRRYYTHSGTPEGVVDNDLQVASLAIRPDARAGEIPLAPVAAGPAKPPTHPTESADVARLRSHRIQAGGKTYQLLRGEFHRHTEISQDGGNDGSLEDMWRYALDAAQLDWIGNGDHDSGGGKEYTWWLVQKATDLYHVPPAFVPMHTYERSVAYPHGHRNVMWPRRGIRTLPRLVDAKGVGDADTKMLYDYLRELDGVCASHTSATGMGTDWRDNDPAVEPFVEIFQGHRNSYEHLGAPRVARRPAEAIGGFRPLGMIWNALAMQYRLGFQASSDHVSTHISYAVALAERPDREAIFDAFKRRHCYGATDNILLDVRCGEHLMGDEFDADGAVRLKILVHGTKPIARVDVIKDFAYVFSSEPHADRVEFEWTDEEIRPPGLSWYYVRAIQEDGELAWGSPMWVHSGAASE